MPMSSRSLGLGFVAGVILLAALLIFVALTGSGSSYRTAYVATHDVPAGAQLLEADVHTIRLPSSGDGASVSVYASSPVGKRVSHRLVTGVLITASDFLDSGGVEVPIALKNSGDFHGNDQIDVGAVINGRMVLIARGLYLSTPGTAVVKPQDEVYWLEVNAAGSVLYAARSGGNLARYPEGGLSPGDALSHLADQAAGISGTTLPGPSSSPTP